MLSRSKGKSAETPQSVIAKATPVPQDLARPKDRKSYATLDLTPDPGEMIKPAETIDIIGVEGLTLQDRRVWNALLANAFGPAMRDQDRDHKIDLNALRASHNSNERIEDSIERLMKTIARCKMPNGSVTRFQLLGGNNMGDPMRPRGELTYSFDKRLVEVLSESISFGKLELAVMAAFSSKYALALYEHVSRRINMRHSWGGEYSLEELREIMGVAAGQLKAFGNFKQRALSPALEEVNLWAPFQVTVAYRKRGQRVVGIDLKWTYKARDARALVRAELEKPKIGRRVRMQGNEESIVIVKPGKLVGENGETLLDLSDDIPN